MNTFRKAKAVEDFSVVELAQVRGQFIRQLPVVQERFFRAAAFGFLPVVVVINTRYPAAAPGAGAAFSVTKGQTVDKVVLSWKTPDGAWYRENAGASGFVQHPVYFEVYRKEAGKDVEYTKLATIKLAPDAQAEQPEIALVFDAQEIAKLQTALDPPYESYYAGASVSYTDTIAPENRGKQYQYYVQSVTDYTPKGKRITSETSCTAVEQGWTVGVPLFSIMSDYEQQGEGNQAIFTKITFAYNIKFENYDVPYSYFIERRKYDINLNQDNSATVWTEYNSVESINGSSNIFEPTENDPDCVYYEYYLYVMPQGSSQADCTNEALRYVCVQASGKYIVTHDAGLIPKIENFDVEDGYADKFVIKWKYNKNYVYSIHYWEIHGVEKGSEIIDEVVPPAAWANADGTLVSYPHDADSGSRRVYELVASLGISSLPSQIIDNETHEEKIFETLGTADPSFTEYEYDKIIVSWHKVQKADSKYYVNASYEGENGAAGQVVAANIEIDETNFDGEKYTCQINQPAGWDDATASGKKIKLTVTAKNTQSAAQTVSTPIDVCTLGPALANLKVAQTIEDNLITVKWDKIKGAAGYQIFRYFYKDGTVSQSAEPLLDTYYTDGNTVSVNGDNISSSRVEIRDNGDGTYLLTDKYCEQESETSTYEMSQAHIAWGLPYGYEIVPVKAGKTENTVAYKNKPQKIGATKGFGLYVLAQKSQSSSGQVVEWTKPYFADQNNPVLYYRGYNDDGTVENKWHKKSVEFESSKTQTKPFEPVSVAEPYEYLIAYGRSASELTKVPASLIEESILGGLAATETRYTYTNVPQEKANKGYILAVDYNISQGSNYSETVEWDEWNYSKRSIGPTGAVLYIRNYNISNGWTEVADLDKDMHYKTTGTSLINTTVTKLNDTELSLAPAVMMDGTLANPVTKGHLQVLRDAKHYYSIKMSRGSYEETLKTKYGYRKISDKEFAKCALMNVAYALYLDSGGNQDLSNVGSQLIHGKPAQSIYIKLSDESYKKPYHYTYASVMPEFSQLYNNPGETRTSVMKTSFDNTRMMFKCNAWFNEYYFLNFENSFNLNVVKYDTDMPDSYSGTLNVTCSDTDNLVIKKDGVEIININSNELRRIYFPAQMASDTSGKDEKQFWIKNSTYGWWPN